MQINNIFKFVFEKLPILNLLDGKKTIIGRVVMASPIITNGLAVLFPHVAIITQIATYANEYATLIMGSGWLTQEVGLKHKQIKAN